jgi:hypothetical protein
VKWRWRYRVGVRGRKSRCGSEGDARPYLHHSHPTAGYQQAQAVGVSHTQDVRGVGVDHLAQQLTPHALLTTQSTVAQEHTRTHAHEFPQASTRSSHTRTRTHANWQNTRSSHARSRYRTVHQHTRTPRVRLRTQTSTGEYVHFSARPPAVRFSNRLHTQPIHDTDTLHRSLNTPQNPPTPKDMNRRNMPHKRIPGAQQGHQKIGRKQATQ